MAKVASMDFDIDKKGRGLSSDIVSFKKGDEIPDELLSLVGSLAVEESEEEAKAKEEANELQTRLDEALLANEKLAEELQTCKDEAQEKVKEPEDEPQTPKEKTTPKARAKKSTSKAKTKKSTSKARAKK
jgi:outer membrane biosynthesis protein TonB